MAIHGYAESLSGKGLVFRTHQRRQCGIRLASCRKAGRKYYGKSMHAASIKAPLKVSEKTTDSGQPAMKTQAKAAEEDAPLGASGTRRGKTPEREDGSIPRVGNGVCAGA